MRHIVGTLIITLFFAEVASSAGDKEPWRDSSGNTHTYQEIGNLATEEMHLDWRPEGWKDIEFAPGRIGYLGMTYVEKKEISVWIRPEHSPMEVAATMVHELAHVFDVLYLTPELRARWISARNLPADTPWSLPCNRCSDFAVGAGDFAESVSFTFQGPNTRFNSKLGPPPDDEQQKLIRSWLNTLPDHKSTCVRVKKIKSLSVTYQEYTEVKDGQTFHTTRMEVCEYPPLFWEIETPVEIRFSNQCTGMR